MLARLVLTSSDPPTSASQSARITGVSHSTWPSLIFMTQIHQRWETQGFSWPKDGKSKFQRWLLLEFSEHLHLFRNGLFRKPQPLWKAMHGLIETLTLCKILCGKIYFSINECLRAIKTVCHL